MKTYPLTISTPDGDLFGGEAAALYLRGADGDLAVLAGHIPFVTTVQPGECRVELEDGSERKGHSDGGLLSVSAENVTLLASAFQWDE